MGASAVSRDLILEQLERVLASSLFQGAVRSCALLKFIVEEFLNGRIDRLKEYTIGADALGRGESFDPRTDPIVRAEASRLRARLERYYAAEGLADPVTIILPKGSYVPQFVERKIAEGHITESAGARGRPMPSRSRRVTWAVAAGLTAALGIGIGAAVWLRAVRLPEAPMVQFDAELKCRGSISGEVAPAVALSPDGARLVFTSIDP